MNLGQIRTAIQAEGYETDSATAQNEIINSVYRRLTGLRHWEWLEATSTAISTVVGTSTYSLATITDLVHVDAVRAELGTNYYPLDFLARQDIRAHLHVDRDRDVPQFWNHYANSLLLYPIPNAVYLLTIDYLQDPSDLASDSDVPLLPLTYHDLLVWGSVAGLAFRQRDWYAYSEAMTRYQGQLVELLNEYGIRQRQNSTEVGHWDGWVTGAPDPWQAQ